MKKAIILISALTLSGAIWAQTDNKNAVVNVENDYNPEVVEVTKKNFTPSDETKANTTPKALVFSTTGKAYNGFSSERDIKDALPQKDKPFPGYARVGYGLTNDIDAKVAYRLGVGKNGALKAYAGFDGYKSNREHLWSTPAQPLEWNSRLFKTLAGFGYSHRFKALTVGIDGSFNNNVFNYQSNNTPIAGYTDKQSGQNYKLAINGASTLQGAFSFNFKGDFEYISRNYLLGEKARLGEGRYGVGAGFGYEVLSKYVNNFGIDLNFDAFTYNSTLKNSNKDYNDYFSIDIDPYTTLKFGKWMLRAGLKMNIITRGEGAFAIAPDIRTESNLLENITFYSSVTGGRTNNSLAKLESITPYWGVSKDGNARLKPTYKIVDVNVGSRITFEPLSMEVSAGYAYTQDDLLETMLHEADTITPLLFVNFEQDNTHHAYAALRLGCDLRSWVKLSADARYDFWSCGNENLLMMKPQITVDANAEARIIEHLTMRVGYNFTRYTKGGTLGRLKNKNDLYARVSYQITKRYGAYIQGNNLLNCKYFDYAGYVTRGIRGSLGVTVNF